MFEEGGNPWENLQKFIRADYHKLPIYFYDTENNLYFSSIGPDGNQNHFLYSLPKAEALHWEDMIVDKMPTLVMASGSEYLYAMVTGWDIYLESDEEDLNPLTRAIIQEFRKREIGWRTDNPVLVKLKFKI